IPVGAPNGREDSFIAWCSILDRLDEAAGVKEAALRLHQAPIAVVQAHHNAPAGIRGSERHAECLVGLQVKYEIAERTTRNLLRLDVPARRKLRRLLERRPTRR